MELALTLRVILLDVKGGGKISSGLLMMASSHDGDVILNPTSLHVLEAGEESLQELLPRLH